MRRTKAGIILAVCLAMCAMLVAGCAAAVDSVNTQEQDEVMIEVFKAIESGDTEVLSQYMSPEYISDSEIQQLAADGLDYVKGEVQEYKKTGWYYNTKVNNGEQTNTLDLSYTVNTDVDAYNVSMKLLETDGGQWTIVTYNVISAEELKGNGAFISFEDFDIVQLLLLLLSVAELALMIIAIVVCAKSKVRRKGLWIPLIVLLHTGFSLILSPQGFHFNLWVLQLNLTSLQKFIDGTRIYNVLVPLGTILFLCLKKRLEWKAEQHRNMQLYRQNDVPPYTPGEDPPEALNMQPCPKDGSGAVVETPETVQQSKEDGGEQG